MSDIYDLHCHSTASDGALSPTELVERACQQGVTHLALTDHDCLDGLAEAEIVASKLGLRLIPGIELSTTWEKKCFHIVGLGIDPNNNLLLEGSRHAQSTRLNRAEKISLKLEKKKIFGAFDAVKAAAGEGMITRTHFANFLLSNNHVSNLQEAFDKYIGDNKCAFVATIWPSLDEAIAWIKAAGGIAVLAHPMRYKLTKSSMTRFMNDFKKCGGQGIEVVYGRSSQDDISAAANLARKFELAGSVGSDFHNPNNQWIELGRLNSLPPGIKPVWQFF